MNGLSQNVSAKDNVFCCRKPSVVLRSMLIGLFVSIVIFLSVGIAAESPDDGFYALLQKGNLTFIQPEAFSIVPIRENRDVGYNYALKHQKEKLEIQYYILPLADNKKLDSTVFWKSNTATVVFNVSSGSGLPLNKEIFSVPQKALKIYNTDAGAFVISQTHQSEFGMEYKHCSIISLYKKGNAQAMLFFLYDDIEAITEFMNKAQYSLRFKIAKE